MNNKKLTRKKNRRRGLAVSTEITAESCRNLELSGLIPSPLESLFNLLSQNDFECLGGEFWTSLNSQGGLELNLSSCPSLQSRKRKFAISYPTNNAALSLCQKWSIDNGRSTDLPRISLLRRTLPKLSVFDPFQLISSISFQN